MKTFLFGLQPNLRFKLGLSRRLNLKNHVKIKVKKKKKTKEKVFTREQRRKNYVQALITGKELFFSPSAVVFNLFHTVAHFPTQANLTTHFDEQN